MTKRIREQKREKLQLIMAQHKLSRASVADLLYISIHTVNAWLKPETTKSSNEVPQWALELLAFKLDNLGRVKRPASP